MKNATTTKKKTTQTTTRIAAVALAGLMLAGTGCGLLNVKLNGKTLGAAEPGALSAKSGLMGYSAQKCRELMISWNQQIPSPSMIEEARGNDRTYQNISGRMERAAQYFAGAEECKDGPFDKSGHEADQIPELWAKYQPAYQAALQNVEQLEVQRKFDATQQEFLAEIKAMDVKEFPQAQKRAEAHKAQLASFHQAHPYVGAIQDEVDEVERQLKLLQKGLNAANEEERLASLKGTAVRTRLGDGYTTEDSWNLDRVREAILASAPVDFAHIAREGHIRFRPVDSGNTLGSGYSCGPKTALPAYPEYCATWEQGAMRVRTNDYYEAPKLEVGTAGLIWEVSDNGREAVFVTLDGNRYMVSIKLLLQGLPLDDTIKTSGRRAIGMHHMDEFDPAGNEKLDKLAKAVGDCASKTWDKHYRPQMQKLAEANLFPTARKARQDRVRSEGHKHIYRACAKKLEAYRKTFVELNRGYDKKRDELEKVARAHLKKQIASN